MNVRRMYGVEYIYADGFENYDIFLTEEEALAYVKSDIWSFNCKPLYVFVADFNVDMVFYEDDYGAWNYDETSETIVSNYQKLYAC